MIHYVYIFKNNEGNHYIGSTANLERRIKDHNSNKSRWTKRKGPWQLVYKERLPTKRDAYLREIQIKRYKGGRAFKQLLENCKS